MNERDGLTLNGLSGNVFHDAIVITVQKTGLKTMFSRGWKSLMFGPVGLCLLIASTLAQLKYLVFIFVHLP